jgi:head-tail adaptor
MPGAGSIAGAGDLRQRVTFAKPDAVSDEFGNVTTGWADQFTVAANIDTDPKLGRETVTAARLEGRQPVVIRVRQYSQTKQIRTDWRATDVRSGAQYNIRSVADPNLGNNQHGRWIDMVAEGGVAV